MKPQLECSLTAGFLRSGRLLANASNCAALIAAGGLFLLTRQLPARVAFAASLLCWPAACYCGLRVSIDARLFRELGRQPEEGAESLDGLLSAWGMGGGQPGRSIAGRAGGAIRWWRRLAAAVAVQLAAMAVGAIFQAGS